MVDQPSGLIVPVSVAMVWPTAAAVPVVATGRGILGVSKVSSGPVVLPPGPLVTSAK